MGSEGGGSLTRSSEPTPSQKLLGLATGYRITQALYVVAKLGVADRVADGPKDAAELARQLGVQPRPFFGPCTVWVAKVIPPPLLLGRG